MDSKITTGEMIKILRVDGGYTLKQVSEATGIAITTLHNIENGTYSIKFDNLKKISNFFGVSPAFFSTESKEKIDAISDALDRYVLPSSGNKIKLIASFDKLNEDGQLKAIERVEELAEVPRYRKEQPDASPKQGSTEGE